MHIGNFLLSELKKQRITIADVAKLVNKSDTGVRKDLEKDSLHQTVIEAYSKVLGMNIYKVLAAEYDGISYQEQTDSKMEVFADSEEPQALAKPTSSTGIEVLSVNIAVPADKQEALLKLLLS